MRFLAVTWLVWGAVFAGGAGLVLAGAPTAALFLAGYGGVAIATLTAGRQAARLTWGRRALLPALAAGVGAVAALGLLPPGLPWGWLHGGVLLSVGGLVGATLGREVADPRHVWPLVVVGAAADLWSVTAPAGLTHSLLEGEGPVSLSTVALHVPVPDGDAVGIAPILGLGDVVFTAFLLGAAARLALSARRSALGLGVGFGLCLIGLLAAQVPLPALPFIALSFAAAQGRAVAPRPRELGMALGVSALLFAAGALTTRLF